MAMLTLLVIPLRHSRLHRRVAGARRAASAAIWNPGPHGLSEMLYAYTSAAGNNGSAFAGLGANSPWYNVIAWHGHAGGRFLMIVPILALAGSLASQEAIVADTSRHLPDHRALWIGLLAGVILIVGALTYFPAYALGPMIEHFAMRAGITFGS